LKKTLHENRKILNRSELRTPVTEVQQIKGIMTSWSKHFNTGALPGDHKFLDTETQEKTTLIKQQNGIVIQMLQRKNSSGIPNIDSKRNNAYQVVQ
jgi:hypothetical protein